MEALQNQKTITVSRREFKYMVDLKDRLYLIEAL